MKKTNKLFSLLAAAVVAMGFSACDEFEDLPGNEATGPYIEIVPPTSEEGEKVDNPSSVNFTMILNGVEQIAYEVVEGHDADHPHSPEEENENGALIFKNATLDGGSGIIDAVEGENSVIVKNLEGNKDYTVYFAFKTVEGTYKIELEEFSTPGYSNIITVLDVTTEGFRVHVEMPDSVYWRWGYSESVTYYEMEQFGTDDLSRLEYNGGLWEKGPKTLDIKNGEVWYEMETEIYDEETWEVIGTEKEPVYHMIFPGYSYIFLLAECDENGTINYSVEGGGWEDWGPLSKLPNVQNYTEEWQNDYITFEGMYAKMQFDIDAPVLQPSQLTIETVKQNERRAIFNIVPSAETVQYAVAIFDQDTYNMLQGWTGPEALKWVALNYVQGIYNDAQQIEVGPLDANTAYKVLIYGSYSDDSMLMSYEELTVTSTPSDKPAAQLAVTPLSPERVRELGYDPAYMVGYNVKCAEGNCAGVKYIANYATEWDNLLNYGMTDADILAAYGVDVFESDDPDFIKGVNSAEGYDVTFTCTEKTEMVIAIAAYNEDEKISDIITSRVTSAEEWGTNPIESPLFEELAGDWTATYKYERHFMDENWQAQKETLEKTFKVNIANGMYAGPAEMDAETYNMLVDYYVNTMGDDEATAKTKVNDNFADFKKKAQHYSDKYRSLNRMIMTGFEPLHAYKSAWDLAIDLNHSAVDNDDLFYDFGPKMFVQISENGATLNSNLSTFPPVSSWFLDGDYTREYYLLGCNGEDYLGDVAFPIEISEDKQTLTIKAMDGGYYPSVGYAQYSWDWGASFACLGLSEIVMTKGWNGPAEVKTRVAKADKAQKINARRGAHRFVKTKLPQSKEAISIMKKSSIDPATTAKKVMKDMKMRQQMVEKLKK